MTNFGFVRQSLPSVHEDCVRAESYLASDPRSACFYARRAVELLVSYLYDVLSLREPYRDDLAAKINDAGFRTRVPPTITQKLTAIRRIANTAVHDTRQIGPDVSLAVLRELFHVIVWVSYHHSAHPELVPLRAQFDPASAARAAGRSRWSRRSARRSRRRSGSSRRSSTPTAWSGSSGVARWWQHQDGAAPADLRRRG